MKKSILFPFCLGLVMFLSACQKDDSPDPEVSIDQWQRADDNPIYRDLIPAENYQSASDPHVFFDEAGELKMIYSGDVNGKSSIKLARGTSWKEWTLEADLLFETGPSNLDISKETAFYRLSTDGKHQIYYIGYNDDSYKAQIFLAEADVLEGPYTQSEQPVVPRGEIAGKEVFCITSPSVVEHEGILYIGFIGWNATPAEVSEVWMMGATSTDEGRTWSDFQIVDTRIGMEGQITKTPDGRFVAVRTGAFEDKEAIYYATADHPFGPWTENPEPIILQADTPLEKDEVIAPQITFDPATGKEYLYYTGADHNIGWWVMLAEKE